MKVLYFNFTVAGVIAFITLCVLMGLAFNRPVEQNEYGVVYNTHRMKFIEILSEGLHTVEIPASIIKVKRNMNEVNFEEVCISKDLIEINIKYVINYLHIKNSIIDKILRNFENTSNYKKFLQTIFKSSILNSCGYFTTEDFYEKRSIVDTTMFNNLTNHISFLDIGSTVEFFQLTNIEFPEVYKNILLEKERIIQQTSIELHNREIQLIKKRTELITAQHTANITMINANNNADITMNLAKTTYLSEIEKWNVLKTIYTHTKNQLNITSNDIIQYMTHNTLEHSVLYTSSDA